MNYSTLFVQIIVLTVGIWHSWKRYVKGIFTGFQMSLNGYPPLQHLGFTGKDAVGWPGCGLKLVTVT